MGSLSTPPAAAAAAGGKELRSITSEELRQHNTPSDLWIAIQGKVYDVTTWIARHPGGDLPILNLAGQDVTDAFVAFHPGSAWRLLDQFLIGRHSDYNVSPVSRDFRRLVAEFSKAGLFEEKGHGVAIALAFMTFFFAVAVSGIIFSSSPYAHLASAACMGFLWIQSGWVGHDSGHYNIMISDGFNRLAQIVTGNCMTGISIGWWKWNHNAHHVACNSLDYDPDLQHIPLFAVSHKFFSSITSKYYNRKLNFDPIARFLVSYQHFTYYPVMVFARFNLYAQSIIMLLTKEKVPNRMQEILGLVVFWIWYPYLVSCLPNWGERVMFVVVSFTVCGLQHVQFTLNHFSGSVYVGRPRGDDWFEKQTAGTVDIACSPWMDWFHGGLQFQVEHHLFPRLPRCHLRKISPIVRELCKKHNLKYVSAPFFEANRLTLRVLRTAAMQARDLTKPVPKNLVWEAFNTHG